METNINKKSQAVTDFVEESSLIQYNIYIWLSICT